MASVSTPEFWTDLASSAPIPGSVRLRQGQEWTVLFRKTNAPV